MPDFPRTIPRWLYAAVPLGFVVMVAILIAVGERTGGPTNNPYDGEGREIPTDLSDDGLATPDAAEDGEE